ncbi:hypothetical protein GOODEAATRI_010937 [Goodea atripinnis]|uniref:Uncharacterized protein n=1 Tax=Goodea atripinnis TaxID=208336 RepID=A0ABV0NLM6_9TELE
MEERKGIQVGFDPPGGEVASLEAVRLCLVCWGSQVIQAGPLEGGQGSLGQAGGIARAGCQLENDPESRLLFEEFFSGVSSKERGLVDLGRGKQVVSQNFQRVFQDFKHIIGQAVTTAVGKTLRRRSAGEPPSYSPPADEATMCTCHTLSPPAPAAP